VHLDAARLNALYNFRPGESVRPFLTAGVGYERTEIVDYGQACDFGWNAGGGLRFIPSPHWNIRAEGRYVRVNVGGQIDKAQSNVEATLGIGWFFGRGGKEEPKAEAVEPPPANRAPSVTCESDRAELLPGETTGLRATASDPDGDPLTYEWNTSAGHVSGSGPAATLDFTGATAPTSATVTVRVSDGHGHMTSCDRTVALMEPARPAEAVSCLAGGFPRNLSRLNNVDKACLDDMAQRLKADPKAHVVVIGYADSHETSAAKISEQRAKAVNDYVVTERGIEASRVTVRSVGATKPLDTGTDLAAQARNRRVEVWFVPEGAKDPE
jgi:outer membrane protein OmpA-like peptidoglycan-associated protein